MFNKQLYQNVENTVQYPISKPADRLCGPIKQEACCVLNVILFIN